MDRMITIRARTPYVFCEPFAGSAALTYWLLGGKPPISYMGGKSGYAPVIADILGLSQHHRPAGIILGEPGPFAAVHATLGGASGSAEDVAGWLTCAASSYRMAEPDSGPNMGKILNKSRPETSWLTAGNIAAQISGFQLPRTLAVAAIIRSWKDEEPRALWERLKAKGWPSLLLPEGCRGRWLGPASLEDVATHLVVHKISRNGLGQRYSERAGGYNVKTGERWEWNWETNEIPVESLPTFPALAVWQGVAEELALPDDLTGFYILMDPPYKGDLTGKITGYKHGDCSRETVLSLARDYSQRGAVVAICESVRLDRDLGDGWTAVDISHARKGQVRSFTRNQGNNRKEPQEWVTLNRSPVHVPAKQVGLW